MPPASISATGAPPAIAIDLSAAIVAVNGAAPLVLCARQTSAGEGVAGLPAGMFDPQTHRTFEIGLRSWVADQTGLDLGYVEQLYTFGDRGRHVEPDTPVAGRHHVSVGYLALTRTAHGGAAQMADAQFQPWYRFFPWEDWRHGRPAILDRRILPALTLWADDADGERSDSWRPVPPRKVRLAQCFGGLGVPTGVLRGVDQALTNDHEVLADDHGLRLDASVRWDEEKTLDRYELLYEAGLVTEALRDGHRRPGDTANTSTPLPACGEPMLFDHRRILATAIGRLRAKLKYRPVIFELMPEAFTLTALQGTVEAITGHHLHKQNFRRQVEGGALVEPTGKLTRTSGRPAALFRFRREVVAERPTPGLRVGVRA